MSLTWWHFGVYSVLSIDDVHWQEWSVTFDADLRFRRFLRRSKAETQGFQTVKESSKTDITTKSYWPLLLNCSNLVPNEESNIELQNAIRWASPKRWPTFLFGDFADYDSRQVVWSPIRTDLWWMKTGTGGLYKLVSGAWRRIAKVGDGRMKCIFL